MTSMLTPHSLIFNEAEWRKWHQCRTVSATALTGPTALTGTHWIDSHEVNSTEVHPGVPGRWRRTADSIIGTSLSLAHVPHGAVELHEGESISNGILTLQAFERQGEFALRTYNRNAPNRIIFNSIATFEPSQQWVIPARLSPDADTVNLTSSDGAIIPTPTIGWLLFELGGLPFRLRVLGRRGKLWTTFSDKSADMGVYRFRFINLNRPDAYGNTAIDFNRAYLPPLAFSEHFLCPTPTPTNKLEFDVEAGEKWPVFD